MPAEIKDINDIADERLKKMRAERDKQVKLRNQLDIALALLGECENKRKHAVNLIEAVRREMRTYGD